MVFNKKKNIKTKSLSRRSFFTFVSTTGLAVTTAPYLISCGHKPILRGPGQVVISQNPKSTNGLDNLDGDVIQQIVDNGIQAFTGINNIGTAWKSIFPTIDKNTTIGLKINCVAGNQPRQLCTQVETVKALVNGLEQMPVNGSHFPREKIIVWERWDDEMEGGGYSLNETGKAEKVIGISKTIKDLSPKQGYDGKASWESIGNVAYFTTILSQRCDYQINVPVLKSIGRGVTFAMKNMYGTFSSTFPQWGEIGSVYHKDFASHICNLNKSPLIRQKFVLHVGDAILGMKNRDPPGQRILSTALFCSAKIRLLWMLWEYRLFVSRKWKWNFTIL